MGFILLQSSDAKICATQKQLSSLQMLYTCLEVFFLNIKLKCLCFRPIILRYVSNYIVSQCLFITLHLVLCLLLILCLPADPFNFRSNFVATLISLILFSLTSTTLTYCFLVSERLNFLKFLCSVFFFHLHYNYTAFQNNLFDRDVQYPEMFPNKTM